MPHMRVHLAAIGLLTAITLGACSDGDSSDPSPAAAAPSPAAAAATAELSTGAESDPSISAAERARAGQLARTFDRIDASVRSVELSELLDGGPGKDGIPALTGSAVSFVSASEADEWLGDEEPVIALEVNGDARAYPLQILMWHEIANDRVGGVPVVVTFCPLCNTALVFDARVNGESREFGVSGLLRFSDLVMYDQLEHSLWQQVTGEAIVGVDTGTRLAFLPTQIVSWEDFKRAFPGAPVLSRETGFSRRYGQNPYFGYDRVDSSPIFPVPLDDNRLQAKERVLTVERDGAYLAFPFSALEEHGVLRAEIMGQPVVAFWQPGTRSALDAGSIRESRDVGSAAAFVPRLDGEPLTFEAREGAIVDIETGSSWNTLGHAIDGPLAGSVLEPVLSANHFWFAWAVFRPETRVISDPS